MMLGFYNSASLVSLLPPFSFVTWIKRYVSLSIKYLLNAYHLGSLIHPMKNRL